MAVTAETLASIALAAGQEIMRVYRTDFSVETKLDASLLTEADGLAEAIILKGLAEAEPGLQVIAEESVAGGVVPEGAAGAGTGRVRRRERRRQRDQAVRPVPHRDTGAGGGRWCQGGRSDDDGRQESARAFPQPDRAVSDVSSTELAGIEMATLPV